MARDLLFEVVQNVAGKTGNHFLLALVENIRSAMDVSWAFIAEGVGDPPVAARMRASVRDGKASEPITYDLEGTPCKLIFEGQSDQVLVPEELWKKFPKEVGFQSYCAAPVHNISGQTTGLLAVISDKPIMDIDRSRDIVRLFSMRVEAELHRLEYERNLEQAVARLERQRDMLSKANSFKSDLLAMIAHDLRNPLQALVSSGELIQSYARMEEGNERDRIGAIEKSCDVIMRTSDRMEKMIALMMKNGRVNATSFEAHCADVPLHRPVKTAIGMSMDAAGRKNIAISERVEPQHHAWVDEDLLIEALDNLIGNAVKFSPEGKQVIVESALSNDGTELRIIDEGLGMFPGEYDHAFRAFQTASSRPTGGETSTGLGLAIVRSIADAHAGDVRVESAGKNKGCIFTLSLPRENAAP